MNITLVCIIYDSINQAIFEGQVLLPLIKRAEEHTVQKIFIVSFERTLTDSIKNKARIYQEKYPAIQFYLYKRLAFINTFLLFKQAYQLRYLLKELGPYTIIARGPFAGIIAKRGITKKCNTLIIQARGLTTQEYSYLNKDTKGIRSLAYHARLHQLHLVEKEAYEQLKSKTIHFYIEVISPALQEYLTLTYQTPASFFIKARFDLPETIHPEQKTVYRAEVRKKLSIQKEATIYVYNGSLKPWQLPQETIHYFKEIYKNDNNAVFLAITPETDGMQRLLKKEGVPNHAYRIVHLCHKDVVKTLCAADYGFLLREKHFMNWVSRPTKLLEYQAAKLHIIHNHTIALLSSVEF